MDSRPVTISGYVRLLRGNRNFRLLWSAQIVSEIGDWLYAVAIYSLLLEFTGKAQSIALAFVLQVLPQFFVSPSAGILNDRISRKKVMIFADWMRAGIVFCMVFVRTPHSVPLLYVLLVLETVMWALFEPGRSAAIPNITAESEMATANALSSTTWSFDFAIGFGVGGVLAAFFGRDAVFVLNALSFAASALLIGRMQFTEPHAENLPPLHWRDLFDYSPIREGIRYVWRDANLRSTIFVKAGLGFMGANWVILPIFGERVFPVHYPGFNARDSGMLGMSLLMACRGIGAIIGPLLAGYWAGGLARRMRWGILFGFIAAGLGYISLGLAPNLPIAGLAVIAAHAGGSVLWVFSSTLLQLQTEDRFRGRVFSAEFGFAVLTMSMSSYTAGGLVDRQVPVSEVAIWVGFAVMIPMLLWAYILSRTVTSNVPLRDGPPPGSR
jgi:MFS family permease